MKHLSVFVFSLFPLLFDYLCIATVSGLHSSGPA